MLGLILTVIPVVVFALYIRYELTRPVPESALPGRKWYLIFNIVLLVVFLVSSIRWLILPS